jgi:hypothetical protein
VTAAILSLMLMIAAIPMALLRAFVLTKLWLWYLVPGFGLAPLTLGYAYGLSLIAGYLTFQFHKSTDKDDGDRVDSAVQTIFFGLIYPLLILFAGWVGKQFM